MPWSAFRTKNLVASSGSCRRLYLVKLILVVAFVFPMVITRNIWFGSTSRFYALTPVLFALPEINYPWDHLVFLCMLALLLLIAVLGQARPWIIGFVALTSVYSLWDQTRWMPYTYQFLVMFLIISGCHWLGTEGGEKEDARNERLLNMSALVLFSIWFWSGLHKLNARYFFVGYPWMLSPFLPHLPPGVQDALLTAAFVTPFIESGGALMLLWPRTRSLGVFTLVGMHLAILLAFGPFGLSFNHSVWSWNVAQILLLLCCFWNRKQPRWKDILWSPSILHRGVLVVFLLFPVGNYFGVWDDFLSHALYSWTTKEAEIDVLSPEAAEELPEEVKSALIVSGSRRFIHVLNWSYHVFESPPYHAHRVFKSVFGKLCNHSKRREDLRLKVYGKPNWMTGKSAITQYHCGPPGAAPVYIEN